MLKHVLIASLFLSACASRDPGDTGQKGDAGAIGTDGSVSVLKPDNTTKTRVGQIQLTQFINPQGLQILGGSVYVETDSSGAPVTTNPGDHGAGTLLQGFLEGSKPA